MYWSPFKLKANWFPHHFNIIEVFFEGEEKFYFEKNTFNIIRLILYNKNSHKFLKLKKKLNKQLLFFRSKWKLLHYFNHSYSILYPESQIVPFGSI